MKKYTHPLLKQTLVQTIDGSIFLKNWLYFRASLRLETDFTANKIWKRIRKENTVESFALSAKQNNLKKVK